MENEIKLYINNIEIAQKLDYGENEINEQAWAEEWKDFLPLEYSVKTQTQSWKDQGYPIGE